MTTAAEDTEKAKEEAIKARNADMEKREEELNASKTGKGTRTFLGLTRGRNPVEIQYENWDDSQSTTLPESLSEFMDVLKVRGITDKQMEAEVVRRLVLGDNELLYKEASDPISEFVDSSWTPDAQKQFKIAIRNYSAGTKLSIEDSVALLKPGFAKAQAAVSK